jgi:hypothetical protein
MRGRKRPSGGCTKRDDESGVVDESEERLDQQLNRGEEVPYRYSDRTEQPCSRKRSGDRGSRMKDQGPSPLSRQVSLHSSSLVIQCLSRRKQ